MASELVPPGAEVLLRPWREREDTFEGPKPSFTALIAGMDASAEEVFAFYDRSLQELDWLRDYSPTLSGHELRGWGWCKPRKYFRLTIADPTEYDRIPIREPSRFRTVFDASIQAVDRACPYTPPPWPSGIPTPRGP